MASRDAHLTAFAQLLERDETTEQLNKRDLQVLGLLAVHDVPLSVISISTMAAISAPYVSRVVEKLVQRGLALRTHDTKDRRLTLLTPTDEGRALNERVRAHFEAASKIST